MNRCPNAWGCPMCNWLENKLESLFFKYCCNDYFSCQRFIISQNIISFPVENCCKRQDVTCQHNQQRRKNPFIHSHLLPNGEYLNWDFFGQKNYNIMIDTLKNLHNGL